MSDIGVQIRTALGAFASEAQQQGRKLRELLDASPGTFMQVVRGMLLEAKDSPELRYVVALLSSRGLLLQMLKEIALIDRGAAGAVAHLAHKMDPGFDKALARTILESRNEAGTETDPEFLLGLLDALTGGFSLLPLLGELRHSDDPRVRARLASLLGKTARAQDWFNALRDDADPRVRANAIEALWGTDGAFASTCFETALQDPHHRVVANGLVGIYMQGEAASVHWIVEMAKHHDPRFRAAAAWAMGRTGDARFVPLLRQMRRDSNSGALVIRSALQAVSRITHSLAAATRREVELLVLGFRLAKDSHATMELVARQADGTLPEFRPTAWSAEVNGEPAWQYEVERLDAPARLACCFLVPDAGNRETERRQHWEAAVRSFLVRRRSHDACAAALYAEEPHPRAAIRRGDILKLSDDVEKRERAVVAAPQLGADSSLVLSSLDPGRAKELTPEGPMGLLGACGELLEAAHGGRHIFVLVDRLLDSAWSRDEVADAIRIVLHNKVTVHCVVTGRTTQAAEKVCRDLSEQTGGRFVVVPSAESAPEAVSRLVASLYRRYEVTFPHSGEPASWAVEVADGKLHGKLVWHKPGQANSPAAA